MSQHFAGGLLILQVSYKKETRKTFLVNDEEDGNLPRIGTKKKKQGSGWLFARNRNYTWSKLHPPKKGTADRKHLILRRGREPFESQN